MTRLRHTVPEGRKGARLAEDEAREIAHRSIEERFGLDPTQLDEVSATPEKQPNRDDWVFTLTARNSRLPGSAEARVLVAIAGDEVVDYRRFVHPPESWRRAERDAQRRLSLLRRASIAVGVLVIVAAALRSLMAAARGSTSRRTFVGWLGLLAALGLIQVWNAWPLAAGNFVTSKDWPEQVIRTLAQQGPPNR